MKDPITMAETQNSNVLFANPYLFEGTLIVIGLILISVRLII